MNATGEYLLLELVAVLRRRMALLCLCWPRQDATLSAGSGTRHHAKNCAAQRVWEYILGLCAEKRDFDSASSLTWFWRCCSVHVEMRCRVPRRVHGVEDLLDFEIQVVRYRMEMSTCCQMCRFVAVGIVGFVCCQELRSVVRWKGRFVCVGIHR